MNEQAHARVAIVTGASRGIGAAISRRLGADGFAVVVHYGNSRTEADEVVRAITSDGGRATAVQAELSDPRAPQALFGAAEQLYGHVDVLVNNAGVMTLAPMAEASDADFDRAVAINLGAAFRGMREAARRMRSGGRIINFSSSVVGLYQPTYGVYAATKAAIEAMTHVLAKELGPRAITVNAVAPGPTATALFLDGKSQALVDAIAKANPQGRLGETEDIAHVVAFLAGRDSQWISGQTVRVNGGVL